MVSPSLVASLVGRGADTSFPSQLAVSPSLAVGVSAVALADSSFPSQLDSVSLSPVAEVSAVAPADSVSWEPQLTLVPLSSVIAELPLLAVLTGFTGGTYHLHHQSRQVHYTIAVLGNRKPTGRRFSQQVARTPSGE